ncbi:MAG: phospho-N-acetylmuramoyl-pentapeptide-transferase [Patescibacteria group bacterium]|nr:phospho-N-acetylmuramoyl-pentapeptide-transferase [Patescibacteria group bacterium]
MISVYLFAVIFSFILNFLLIVPFINFLYKINFKRQEQTYRDVLNKPTPVFERFNRHKQGTPIGGGILILITTTLVFFLFIFFYWLLRQKILTNYPSIASEIKIILFTFISFGLLGLIDDLNKVFFWKKTGIFGLKMSHKFFIQLVLSLIISWLIFSELKIQFLHVPFVGVFDLGYFYILFSAFIIVAFANAVNITDGLDGLAAGILCFSLLGFWVIARSILDVPTSLFIAAWLGGLISFLYFNIWPSRIMMGDAGALAFGATFAVIGLLLGKIFSLAIIGGIFVIEVLTSLIQILGKKILRKKIFPVAPLHLYLQHKGWEEPKIVMRLWLISIVLVIFGLMIAFIK